jgi:hypothetical protein
MVRKLAALLAIACLSCVPDAPDGDIPTGLSVQPELSSVSLAWDSPTLDAGGQPLGDLAGYRLYYSRTMPPDGPEGTSVEVGDATQFTVSGLAADTWYFAVTAVDDAGNESALSEALPLEVGGP